MSGRPPSLTRRVVLRRAGLSIGVSAVLVAASGCGQTGPLALPERAPAASGERGDEQRSTADDSAAEDEQSSRNER